MAALADKYIDVYLEESCALKEVMCVEEHSLFYSVHKNVLSACNATDCNEHIETQTHAGE